MNHLNNDILNINYSNSKHELLQCLRVNNYIKAYIISLELINNAILIK